MAASRAARTGRERPGQDGSGQAGRANGIGSGMMIKLAIDFENPAREWWENGGQELWDSITEGFDNNDVAVDESIAQSWLAEAAKIPGWVGGPEFSPHPICLKEVDEDEEV